MPEAEDELRRKERGSFYLKVAYDRHHGMFIRGVQNNRFDINHQCEKSGATVLHVVSARRDIEKLRALLASERLDHLVTDKRGWFASDYADWYGADPALALFLRKRELKQAKERGVSITHQPWYSERPKPEISEKTSALGREFLKAAAKNNVLEMQRLAREGAPVNYQDPETLATALHVAAAQHATDAVRFLRRVGKCNFLLSDIFGQRATDIVWYDKKSDPTLNKLILDRWKEQKRDAGEYFRRMPAPGLEIPSRSEYAERVLGVAFQ